MSVQEDLDKIERSIRQLQIEWEKFFGGVEKRPPTLLKDKLERLIRQYAGTELRRNADRFRYQSLSARYAVFAELWAKRLRAVEEGRPVGFYGRNAALVAAALPPPPPPPEDAPVRPSAGAERPSSYRVQDAERDEGAVRALFDSFIEARRQSGEGDGVKFESFQKIIAQQSTRIMEKKGGEAVEFRLETKDGKVSLKAKVVS